MTVLSRSKKAARTSSMLGSVTAEDGAAAQLRPMSSWRDARSRHRAVTSTMTSSCSKKHGVAVGHHGLAVAHDGDDVASRRAGAARRGSLRRWPASWRPA